MTLHALMWVPRSMKDVDCSKHSITPKRVRNEGAAYRMNLSVDHSLGSSSADDACPQLFQAFKTRFCFALLALLLIAGLAPTIVLAQAKEQKSIMIFPFKMVEPGKKPTFSPELSAVLSSQLTREGDVAVVPAAPFMWAVQGKRINNADMSRVAEKQKLTCVIWGEASKVEEGYKLDVWAAGPDPKIKPKLFSTTAHNIENLVVAIRSLSASIGGEALGRPTIGDIKIEGNHRIKKDAIMNRIEMKKGSAFERANVSDDVKRIYAMGYFDDVNVDVRDTSNGQAEVVFVVKERPSLKEIDIKGASVLSKDQILDAITTKSFSVANPADINKDIETIKDMYEKKGYYRPKITYETKEISPSEAKLEFKVEEGVKAYLDKIVFDGRKLVDEDELKKILSIKPWTFYWFLDESGAFTREKLDENRMRLIAYYRHKGFIDAQVGEPEVDIKGNRVTVTYPIREGDRFQVRKVNVVGDLKMPEKKMLEMLKTKPKNWFQGDKIQADIKKLTKTYNNLGYAYADVQPQMRKNDEHDFVDITYNIREGKKVKIEKVTIRGNERTRDKIIRRGLAVNEGDYFSANAIDASKKSLEGMDFFEAVKIRTEPGSRPDLMDVEVDVIEKKTGTLAAGMGFSSQEGATGNVNLSERNLLGLGIVANVKGNISARKTTYEGSLSYPWILDIPLSGTLKAYNTATSETKYLRNSTGFGVYWGYPVFGLWRMDTGFAHDSSKLSNFKSGFEEAISQYYNKHGFDLDKFKKTTENSIALSFSRDTRNNGMLPTDGAKVVLGSRFSGLGGDVAFTRLFAEGTYYRPLVWRAVFKVRSNYAMLLEAGENPIPFDRRIMLGGISTVRGYEFGDIGPQDGRGNVMGGDRGLFTNVECLFPLIDKLKMNGVVFFDVGNAWNAAESPLPEDLKAGAGVGIRWMSPMGPLRIEYGWKLRPEPGQDPGHFAFAMGQLF